MRVSEARPAIDVVVVSWNTREDLLGCIGSVLRSDGVDPRVTVVDNASADGSADAVAARFPSVQLIRNRRNEGFARAVNQGIARGTAPLVLLLNPDAEVPPDGLATLTARLAALPGHAAVAPRLVGADGEPQQSAYGMPSLGVSLLLALGVRRLLPRRLRSHLLLVGDWHSDLERDVPWVIGAALLVRRSVVEDVGALDEGFFVYAEDMEWCDRMGRAGWRIRFLPEVVLTHTGNRSGAQRYGADRTAAYLRNSVRFVRRRHGALWTVAFVGINGVATVSRYAAWRFIVRLHPTAAGRSRLALWRPYARFYLRRARPVDAAVPGEAAAAEGPP